MFVLTEYEIWKPLQVLMRSDKIMLYPFLGHALIISLFVSIVGPFGGFFASGFKRAFKVGVIRKFFTHPMFCFMSQDFGLFG